MFFYDSPHLFQPNQQIMIQYTNQNLFWIGNPHSMQKPQYLNSISGIPSINTFFQPKSASMESQESLQSKKSPINEENEALQGEIAKEKFQKNSEQNKNKKQDDLCRENNSLGALNLVKKLKGIKKKKQKGVNKVETKNLLKNYGKAMLSFMIKAKEKRNRVVQELKIPEEQFLDCIYEFRNQLHTICAFRYLWKKHPFCKAFRILSGEYIRKYNLHHIFNSRISNYDLYLKYARKMRKSVKNPQSFESIKE